MSLPQADRSTPSSLSSKGLPAGSQALRIAPDLTSFRVMISQVLPVAIAIEVDRRSTERFEAIRELRARLPAIPCIEGKRLND